jgi:murein DD-endopeptidase / murein LD-carboxypeptidase
MNIFFKVKNRLILLVVVCQLLTTFCSTQLFPGTSFPNIESQAEKNMLSDFMVEGTGKMPDTHHTNADQIIKTAQKYLGVPHCMGGTTMKCMDCSGLLVTVFAAYDIQLPHNSEEQARYGTIIAGMDELRKGDLVFFIRTYKTTSLITHSGIYIGNNNFIHTSSSKGVTVTSLSNPWWEEKFIFGTRVFN